MRLCLCGHLRVRGGGAAGRGEKLSEGQGKGSRVLYTGAGVRRVVQGPSAGGGDTAPGSEEEL